MRFFAPYKKRIYSSAGWIWQKAFKEIKVSNAPLKQKTDLRLKGRISTSPIFKRQLLKPPFRKALLKELDARLNDKTFFSKLNPLGTKYGRVKEYEFMGVQVAVKNTDGTNSHGGNYKEIRKDIMQHQIAVRKGQINAPLYILRTPRVYGVVDNYLIMEKVKDMRNGRHHNDWRQEPTYPKIVDLAYTQLAENLRYLKKTKKSLTTEIHAQVSLDQEGSSPHFIPTGIENGKVIFYAPYDAF